MKNRPIVRPEDTGADDKETRLQRIAAMKVKGTYSVYYDRLSLLWDGDDMLERVCEILTLSARNELTLYVAGNVDMGQLRAYLEECGFVKKNARGSDGLEEQDEDENDKEEETTTD